MIVEAVAISANALDPARRPIAKRIEAAIAQAVLDAAAEGVTDPEEVRRRMLAARERAKASCREVS